MTFFPRDIERFRPEDSRAFSRTRKLPFARLIVLILQIVGVGGSDGIEIKVGELFRSARRHDLWPGASTASRSALSKARKKLGWRVFQALLRQVVSIALEFWPKGQEFSWHEMTVIAIDGSKYTLPATKELCEHFDPETGLENPGKGHFPQSLVSTAYDVFRRIPVARTVMPMATCERQEAIKMVPLLPPGLLLFDRGYPSYGFLLFLLENYAGHFLFRCPARQTFPALQRMLATPRKDQVIRLSPSAKYTATVPAAERRKLQPIEIRAVVTTGPEGQTYVYLTDLLDKETFPPAELSELYRRRWEVENHYRDEKVSLEVEAFHSRSPDGIRQELFAAVIMTVIARVFMVLSKRDKPSSGGASDCHATEPRGVRRGNYAARQPRTRPEPQFKNAIKTIARDLAALATDNEQQAFDILAEALADIWRIKYHRPVRRRPSQPRVTKHNKNKWIKNRGAEMKAT